MTDRDYLAAGLNALARAPRVSSMAGHLGAAVVAGCFLREQYPDLDDRVWQGIEREVERIMRGESVFSPGANASISAHDMFETFPAEQPRESLVAEIATALAGNIGETHQSGHNVIFASIAIRALTCNPHLATPSVVNGICGLIATFDRKTPGNGYYGKARGRIDGRQIQVQESEDTPPYSSLESMANTVVEQLIKHAPERRDGYGGLWHVINHAAGLVDLARWGYPDLATQGLPAHHRHLLLWQTVPDVADEFGPETPTLHDPRTAAFWQSGEIRRERAHLTHRIKTIYGLTVLVDLVSEREKRDLAFERLLYLM